MCVGHKEDSASLIRGISWGEACCCFSVQQLVLLGYDWDLRYSCNADDDNKNTLHIIKWVKENSTKDTVKSLSVLMVQVGISGSKSRSGEEVKANSTEFLFTLGCSVVWDIASAVAGRDVHLSQLLQQPRNTNGFHAVIVLTLENCSLPCVLALLDSDCLSAKECCSAETKGNGLVPIFVAERLFY